MYREEADKFLFLSGISESQAFPRLGALLPSALNCALFGYFQEVQSCAGES